MQVCYESLHQITGYRTDPASKFPLRIPSFFKQLKRRLTALIDRQQADLLRMTLLTCVYHFAFNVKSR